MKDANDHKRSHHCKYVSLSVIAFFAIQSLYFGFGNSPKLIVIRDPMPTMRNTSQVLDKRNSEVYINTKEFLEAKTTNIYSLPPLTRDYFVKGIKNPCLALNTKTLMFQKHVKVSEILDSNKFELKCLPHHLLIGFMKCGTTDLSTTLHKHQLISGALYFGRRVKEAHFWENPSTVLCKTMKCYLKMYDGGAGQILRFLRKNRNTSSYDDISSINNQPIMGDYTPQYISKGGAWKQDAANKGKIEPSVLVPQKMKKFHPNAKIIVSMRDPTDRLRSHINHEVRYKIKKQKDLIPPSKAELHNQVVNAVEWWRSCTSVLSEKTCAYVPREQERDKFQLRNSSMHTATKLIYGMYAIHIREYLEMFDRSQILFVKLEDIKKERVQVYKNKILHFLGISSLDTKFKSYLNEGQHIGPPHYITFANETISILNEFYKPYNKRLVELLEDDNFKWYYD